MGMYALCIIFQSSSGICVLWWNGKDWSANSKEAKLFDEKSLRRAKRIIPHPGGIISEVFVNKES